jgi:hypothetical protein
MGDANKDRLEIRRLKKQLRVGSSTAANNIAATYRKLGNARRAFHWWRRTAGSHDGDAWLEVGYCLQYGIGTRRDAAAAIRAYRKAMQAITRRNTVARKLSIIWPLRLWTATPCGRIERSNACSTKRLKTATIHKRRNYKRDSLRSSHCAFVVVVVVSHVAWAGRPIAHCIDGP